MSDRPTISIVIPTLDEEDNLRRCLAGIVSQDYPRELVEVIVVDNGSADATCDVAGEGSGALHAGPLHRGNSRSAPGQGNAPMRPGP